MGGMGFLVFIFNVVKFGDSLMEFLGLFVL